ncbi:MAG: cache domain-containing protein [Bacteroidota bacterium]|nr:cache domain-containing protein [Bacteroidota bacterium]
MKNLSFNRNNIAVLITLAFVLFCGAIYFFIYVPSNEKALQEQRFRTLQNIEENIHKKIGNSVALMNNLLKDTVDVNYIDYLNSNSKEKFTLVLPKGNNQEKLILKDINDSDYTINVNNLTRQIILLLTKRNITAKDTLSYQLEMKWSFKQFVESLLPKNVFDQFIIFSDGEVVFETFPSGLNYFKDSLLDKKNGIVTSLVKPLNVSGTDYKMFSQPVSFTTDKLWVITGLLSDARYQQEKNQLPTKGVLLLVTVAFIILVTFPWFKLYQMGSKDRLTIVDGVSSIVVSMLLMSMIFIAFFKYDSVFKTAPGPNSRDTLATQIRASFQNEINKAYNNMHAFENAIKSSPGIFKDIINLDNDSISFKNGSKSPGLEQAEMIAKSLDINQVFWLDKNGNEKVNWIPTRMGAPHGNFKNREYFKRIVNHEEYFLNNDTAKKYYLGQIISWTSGTFTSVLTIPSAINGAAIGAVSFNITSLHNALLPVGYSFAIIDNNANVLYHSDESRNLNENLLDEFSDKEALTSNIEARTNGEFETNYFNNKYDVSIRPIKDLPYFIVIFDDTSFSQTSETEIYSFTISMMLLFFGFLVFELFAVLMVSSKRSFFKRQQFDTSWIGPKIPSHHQYNLAIVFNLVVIILVVAFFKLSTFLTYLYILLFSVTFISIFLTALFALRYKNENSADNYRFKILSLQWLFVFVFIIDVAAIRTLNSSSFFILIIYEVLTFIAGWIFFKNGDQLLNWLKKKTNGKVLSKWNFKKSFSAMGLTRLLITSGIPVIFFYITSYNFEQNITVRYRQLQYENQFYNKLNGRFPKNMQMAGDISKGFYYDGACIKDIYFTDTISPEKYSKEETITAKILGLFHINISPEAIKEEKFYTENAADTSFFYNHLLKEASRKNNQTISYFKTGVPGKFLAISATGLNYKFPSIFKRFWFNGLLFWVLLFFTVGLFYLIIYKIVGKLFCLGLPDVSAWDALDDKTITSSTLNKLLFIIGLPGSGKLNRILDKIKKGEIANENEPLVYMADDDAASNVYIADLINTPDYGDNREADAAWLDFKAKAFQPKNKLIIVTHFEYNIQDAVTNRLKLNLLENLMLDTKSSIIILSTVHPVAFLDSIIEQAIDENEKAEPGQDLERWHVLLGHYRIIIFSLQHYEINEPQKYLEPIYKETQQTHFLIKTQPYAIDIANQLTKNGKEVNGDELALKLQGMAHYFYMYIWESLTQEEKFLLYDLAEDNLVNSYDDYDLNMLLAKGVIMRPDGSLKLFNKGFRNFILTAIGNTELTKIKNNMKDNGNWSKLRNPLLIIMVAILSFLVASQQEIYSKLISYVAALVGGIPVILKLFSFFSKNDPKNS